MTLPNVLKKMPLPPMAEKTMYEDKAGVYAFRLSKGFSITGEKTYFLQTISILGFVDEFSSRFTLHSTDISHITDEYMIAVKKAEKHYEKLKKEAAANDGIQPEE